MPPNTMFYTLLSFNTLLNEESRVPRVHRVPTLTHSRMSHLLCPQLPCLSQEGGHIWSSDIHAEPDALIPGTWILIGTNLQTMVIQTWDRHLTVFSYICKKVNPPFMENSAHGR